jgi:hypothetical protein
MQDQEKDRDENQPKQSEVQDTGGAGQDKPASGEPRKKTATHPHKAPGTKHRAGERKRKKMSKGLLLAFVIGAIAIVAVIFVFASSGGMTKDDLAAAKATLRSIIANSLEGKPEAVIPSLDVQLMLRYVRDDEFKKWKELTAEQKAELAKVAFDSVREKVGRIGIKDLAAADALLAGAQMTSDSRTMQVQYEMKVGEISWNATLGKRDTGWLLLRLEPIR